MRHIFTTIALILVGSLVSGCSKLTATTTAVSFVTSTPVITDAQNGDPSVLAAIGTSAIPAATAALVGVGERDSVTSQDVTPVSNATVKVRYGSNVIPLCAQSGSAGTYQTSSAPGAPCTSTLSYETSVEYTTTIDTDADTFTLKVTTPAAIDPAHVEFTPALTSTGIPSLSLVRHARNTELLVDWSASPVAGEKRVVLSVLRVNYTGANFGDDAAGLVDSANWSADEQNPVYTNLPQKAADMFSFITDKPTSETIPSSVFDHEGLYLLVVTQTEMSTDTSDNLSIGSTALAGKGTGFLFIAD